MYMYAVFSIYYFLSGQGVLDNGTSRISRTFLYELIPTLQVFLDVVV